MLKAYAPKCCRWFKLSSDFVAEVTVDEKNQTELTDAESDRPLLLRGGSILPVVGTLPKPLNTNNLRKRPIELWVLPSWSNASATGDFFYDDGESIDTVKYTRYNLYRFEWRDCQLNLTAVHSIQLHGDSLKVERIRVAVRTNQGKVPDSDQIELKVSGHGSEAWKPKVAMASDKHQLIIEDSMLDLSQLSHGQTISISVANKADHQCFIK